MPKIVDREAYREELLLKSFDLFARHGYAALTLRKLAQGLGVSTGTLYHYFDGKEDIFTQLVELTVQRVVDAGVAEVSVVADRNGQIRSVVAFARRMTPVFQDFLRIAVDSTRVGEPVGLNEIIAETVDRLHDTIVEVIVGFEPADAVFLFDALAGLVLRALLRDAADRDEDESAEWNATEKRLLLALGDS